jgi:Bifunctional DNA primase/polymerase, N-terminal/Primase C terminal 2 (PriCT-2)
MNLRVSQAEAAGCSFVAAPPPSGISPRDEFTTPRPTAALPPSRNAAFDVVASELLANGYSPIPLTGKQPKITGWPKLFCESRPMAADLTKWGVANRGRACFDGIGLACHDGVIFFDIDVDEWQPVYGRLIEMIPGLDRAPVILGRRGAKLIVRASDGQNHQGWNIPLAKTRGVLEVLAWHRQGVIAPTRHPVSKQPYRYLDEARTPHTMPIGILPVVTDEHIEAIRAAWPPEPPKAVVHAEARQKAARNKTESRKELFVAQRWAGNAAEMQRATNALGFLNPDSHMHWSVASQSFASWAPVEGRAVWDAWSRKSAKFDPAKQDQQWQAAMIRIEAGKGASIAAVIEMAHKLGFDKRIHGYQGAAVALQVQRAAAGDSDFDKAVAALPTAQFHIAINAHRRLAMSDKRLQPVDVRLLDSIHGFISTEAGYAWPSSERLASLAMTNKRGIADSLRALQRTGYICKGPFKANPQHLATRSIAITPPDGRTWEELLALQGSCFGHATKCAKGNSVSS